MTKEEKAIQGLQQWVQTDEEIQKINDRINRDSKIMEYLPFYLGCECMTKWFNMPAEVEQTLCPLLIENFINNTVTQIKPILRPLSDMTEEEYKEKKKLMYSGTDGVHAVIVFADSPESFKWMLDKGFDIFGLIESGFAVDKTKLK